MLTKLKKSNHYRNTLTKLIFELTCTHIHLIKLMASQLILSKHLQRKLTRISFNCYFYLNKKEAKFKIFEEIKSASCFYNENIEQKFSKLKQMNIIKSSDTNDIKQFTQKAVFKFHDDKFIK